MLARLQMRVHPFDLVRKHIRRGVLNRSRKIQDDRPPRPHAPRSHCGVTRLQRHLELRETERLGGILEHPFGFRMLLRERPEIAHLPVDELHHFLHAHAEHHAAPDRRRRVVDVNDGAPRADEAFYGALDQRLARLGEHHQRDVIRHESLFDERAHGVEIDLRGGGEPHLDLLESHVDQHLEQAFLGLAVHGFEQRLIAIPQVGAAPDGRGRDLARRPLAVGQVDDGERTVSGRWIAQHVGIALYSHTTDATSPALAGAVEGSSLVCADW